MGGNGTSEKAVGVWGQKIGTDAYPVWNGDTVYGVVADAKEYIGNKGTKVALPAITPWIWRSEYETAIIAIRQVSTNIRPLTP